MHSAWIGGHKEWGHFTSRLWVCGLFVVTLTGILFARLYYLQVHSYDFYQTQSTNNHTNILPIAPTRGQILDRHGNLLATNKTVYSLEIIPEQVTDIKETLLKLNQIVPFNDTDLERFEKQRERQRAFIPATLKVSLTETEMAAFSVRESEFPGVSVQARLVRDYPYGSLMAHVLGYVGAISEKELKEQDADAIWGIDTVGKLGIEAALDNVLRGKAGQMSMAVNAKGRPLGAQGLTPPESGQTVRTTLDVKLQEKAYELLGNRTGSLILMHAKTGGILAMASQPAFDPNQFVSGLSHAEYANLRRQPGNPLYDRSLRGLYPPASVIKPAIAIAALSSQVITAKTEIYDPGYYQPYEEARVYRNWKRDGHGKVNLARAIPVSCDTYFYQVAEQLGIDRISVWLEAFGFGQPTDLGLPGEAPGVVPSRDWKRRTLNKSWFVGDTLNTGIGQGYLEVTPLQVANMMGLIARQGVPIKPTLWTDVTQPPSLTEELISVISDSAPKPSPNILDVAPSHWRQVQKALEGVIHSHEGTAHYLTRDLNYRMAGKTGTAQVYGLKEDEIYDASAIDKRLRDHAWFAGYAPAKNPEVVVVVLSENEKGSSKLAKKMLDYYFAAGRS